MEDEADDKALAAGLIVSSAGTVSLEASIARGVCAALLRSDIWRILWFRVLGYVQAWSCSKREGDSCFLRGKLAVFEKRNYYCSAKVFWIVGDGVIGAWSGPCRWTRFCRPRPPRKLSSRVYLVNGETLWSGLAQIRCTTSWME